MSVSEILLYHGCIIVLVFALLLFMSLWLMMPQLRERFALWAKKRVESIGNFLGKSSVLITMIWITALLTVSSALYLNHEVQFTSGMLDALSFCFCIVIVLVFPFSTTVYYYLMRERKTWDAEALKSSNFRRAILGSFKHPLKVYAQWILGIIPFFLVLFWAKPYTIQTVLWLILLGADVVFYIAVISLASSLIARNVFEALVHSYVILGFYIFFLPYIANLNVETDIIQCISPFFIAIFPLWKLDWKYPFSSFGSEPVHQNWMIFHWLSSAIFLVVMIAFCQWRIKKIVGDSERVTLWMWIKQSLWKSFKNRNTQERLEVSPLSDWGNPVASRELRDYFLYHRASMIKTILGGLICSLLLFWFFPAVVGDMRLRLWGNNLELPLLVSLWILPFFIVPYAANTFRHEQDKNTWDLITTTTLSSRILLHGKLWGGFGLFSIRLWIFLMPVLFLGYMFWSWGGNTYSNFWLLFWNFVGIAYSFFFLVLFFAVWVSIQAKKTTTSFILALLIPYMFVICPPFIETFCFSWMNWHSQESICGILSPVYLLSRYRQYHTQDWWYHLRNIQMSLCLVLSGAFYYLSLFTLDRNRNLH